MQSISDRHHGVISGDCSSNDVVIPIDRARPRDGMAPEGLRPGGRRRVDGTKVEAERSAAEASIHGAERSEGNGNG